MANLFRLLKRLKMNYCNKHQFSHVVMIKIFDEQIKLTPFCNTVWREKR